MELWDVYDAEGNKTGLAEERQFPMKQGEYHLAMELWIVNDRHEILIQKRSETKEVLPGIWALTTGCAKMGETSLTACLREAREEIGIGLVPAELRHVRRIVRADAIWDVYAAKENVDIAQLTLQAEEVTAVQWVDEGTFRKMLNEGLLYRYPEIEEMLNEVLKATA